MSDLVGFAIASAAVLLVPGPTVVYVATRTARHGLAAGVASVLGVETGTLVHVAATSLGLGVLVSRHEWLLHGIQYLGVAYLAFLGVRELMRGRRERLARLRALGRSHKLDTAHVAPRAAAGAAPPPRMLRHVASGVLVDLLNPKTTLFFLAFLPQFVDVEAGGVPWQVLSLGLLFLLFACAVDLSYAVATHALRGQARAWRRERPERPWQSRLTAGIYFGLSGVAALA